MSTGSGRKLASVTDIGLAIFDCDGVLIDSELLSAQVLLDELAHAGAEFDLPYFFQNCLGRHFAAVADRIGRDTGQTLGDDFEHRFRNRFLEKFERELEPIARAREVLTRLRIPFCVATSSSTERAARSRELAGLSGRVGGRLFSSSMVARGKPLPDLFLPAVRQFVQFWPGPDSLSSKLAPDVPQMVDLDPVTAAPHLPKIGPFNRNLPVSLA